MIRFYCMLVCFGISEMIFTAQPKENAARVSTKLYLDPEMIEEGIARMRTNSGHSSDVTKFFTQAEQLSRNILCEEQDTVTSQKNYQYLSKKHTLIDFGAEDTKNYADKCLECSKKLLEDSTD